jgi:hypothetical protein
MQLLGIEIKAIGDNIASGILSLYGMNRMM